MLATASKYTDVRAAGRPAVPNVIVRGKRVDRLSVREFVERELKEGRMFHRYIEREKATSDRRIRAVAAKRYGARANSKSEHQWIASIPAREYFRWLAVDKDFWKDDANLRSLRRSNDDLRHCIKV